MTRRQLLANRYKSGDGCGFGWSSIGMAQAYAKIRVDGYDLDEPSVEAARANAGDVGLNGHVTFQARDAGDPTLAGEQGTVIIMHERVDENFDPGADDVERMMYGWSALHCLPVGMADEPSVGTGTVMRTETLRRYAQAAGFSDLEVLPIDSFFFRFYRLRR